MASTQSWQDSNAPPSSATSYYTADHVSAIRKAQSHYMFPYWNDKAIPSEAKDLELPAYQHPSRQPEPAFPLPLNKALYPSEPLTDRQSTGGRRRPDTKRERTEREYPDPKSARANSSVMFLPRKGMMRKVPSDRVTNHHAIRMSHRKRVTLAKQAARFGKTQQLMDHIANTEDDFKSPILSVGLKLQRILDGLETSSEGKSLHFYEALELVENITPASHKLLFQVLRHLLCELVFSDHDAEPGDSTNNAMSQEYKRLFPAQAPKYQLRKKNDAFTETRQFQVVDRPKIVYKDLSFRLIKQRLKQEVSMMRIKAKIKKIETKIEKQSSELTDLVDFDAKKDLQVKIYERAKGETEISVTMLKQSIKDVEEELEQASEEHLKLKHSKVTGGLTFRTHNSVEGESEESITSALSEANQRLDEAKTKTAKVKEALSVIYTERDLLLTRIEVLERAVQMMHTITSEMKITRMEDYANNNAQDSEQLVVAKDSPLAKECSIHTHIPGKGTNAGIPSFLHCPTGSWISKKEMEKEDMELRIKELWSVKSIGDQKARQHGDKPISLPEYYAAYLKEHYGYDKNHLLHFSYNFIESLEQHSIDSDFILCLKILYQDMHEVHYYDQMMMLANFKAFLTTLDDSDATSRDDSIPVEEFFDGLRTFFPTKTKVYMYELQQITMRDLINEEGQVSVDMILEEGEEHFQSDFIECVREQYLMEVEQFTQEIYEELILALHMEQFHKQQLVKGGKFFARIAKIMQKMFSAYTKPVMPDRHNMKLVGQKDDNEDEGDEGDEAEGDEVATPAVAVTVPATQLSSQLVKANLDLNATAPVSTDVSGVTAEEGKPTVAAVAEEPAKVDGDSDKNKASEGDAPAPAPAPKSKSGGMFGGFFGVMKQARHAKNMEEKAIADANKKNEPPSAKDDEKDELAKEEEKSAKAFKSALKKFVPSNKLDQILKSTSVLHSHDLCAADIEACLRRVDPNKTEPEIKEYMIRGTGDPYFAYDTKVDVRVFMRNLKVGGQINRTDHWKRIYYI